MDQDLEAGLSRRASYMFSKIYYMFSKGPRKITHHNFKPTVSSITHRTHVHPKSAKSQSRSYDGKTLSYLLDQYHQMTVIMAWI
jgi:hypothetical protein